MRHRAYARARDLQRPCGPDVHVRPHRDPLPAGLGRDRREQVPVDRRVGLDPGRPGPPCQRHGLAQVRLLGDRLHPGNRARRLTRRRRHRARVGEELGAGHQRRKAQVGRVDLLHERSPLQVHERAYVARHVPRRRDAAVKLAVEDELGPGAVRHRGHVSMRLDQARDREPRTCIHHFGPIAPLGAQFAHRKDRDDLFPLQNNGHIGPRGSACAVDHRRALEDDPGGGLRLRVRHLGLQTPARSRQHPDHHPGRRRHQDRDCLVACVHDLGVSLLLPGSTGPPPAPSGRRWWVRRTRPAR